MRTHSRRSFLQEAAAGVAGVALIPSGAHGVAPAAAQDRVAEAQKLVLEPYRAPWPLPSGSSSRL